MRRKDISSDRKITAARPVYIGGDALFARRIRLCRMHRAPQRTENPACSTSTLAPASRLAELAHTFPLSSPDQHGDSGLVYSLIGHRIGYSHSQEVSRCIHKRLP